jgi:hypothetical protein
LEEVAGFLYIGWNSEDPAPEIDPVPVDIHLPALREAEMLEIKTHVRR